MSGRRLVMESRNLKRPIALLFVAAIVANLLLPTRAQTPRLTLHKIIELGDQAPGFKSGSTIQSIEDVPRMDRNGDTSFVLSVLNSAGGNQTAIYRHLHGRPDLAFRTGDPAPGVSGGAFFTGFPNVFPLTPRIENGRVTFGGNISGDNALFGIWSDLFGDFSLEVLQGDRLPGMPTD